jgi:hypothetical protein
LLHRRRPHHRHYLSSLRLLWSPLLVLLLEEGMSKKNKRLKIQQIVSLLGGRRLSEG